MADITAVAHGSVHSLGSDAGLGEANHGGDSVASLRAVCRQFGIAENVLVVPGRDLLYAITVPGSKEHAGQQKAAKRRPGTDAHGRRRYHCYVMSDVVLLVKEAPASVANTSDISITHHLKWLDYQAFTMRNDFSETPLGCPLRLDCRVPESVTYVLWCSDSHSRDAFEQALEEGQEVAFSSQAATGRAHDRPTTATTTHASPSRPRSRRASSSPDSGAQPDSSPATTPPWLGSADRSVGSHLEARVERVRTSLSRSWKSRLGATGSSDRSSAGRAAMLLDTLESLKRQREARSSMRARKRGHDHGASGRSMDLAEAAAEVEATAGPGKHGSGLAGLLRLQQTGSTSWTALRDMLDVDVAKYVVPPQSESYAPIEKNSLRRYRIYKEIIDTERQYVEDLQTTIALFVLPMLQACQSSSPDIVAAPTIGAMFSNIEVLLCVNTELLQRLCSTTVAGSLGDGAEGSAGGGGAASPANGAGTGHEGGVGAATAGAGAGAGAQGSVVNGSSGLAEDGTDVDTRLSLVIANAFATIMPYFRTYYTYCKNFHSAMALVKKEKETNEVFAGFLQYNMRQPRAGGKDIGSFLIKPVQRICKYQLFFNDILGHMAEDHPSYQQLHHSAETVRQIASEVNSRITQSERDARMVELDARLGGKERIVDAHRHLVMELESVGFSQYSHEQILQPSRQHHCPASDTFSGHRSLQMFLLTDLLIFARTATGLLKGSRVKLVHKFDLCSLVLLQAEPVASAAPPSSNRGAPGFGVVVRVDTRLIARHIGGSVLGKASASTEEVGGFVIWLENRAAAQKLQTALAAAAETCRTTQSSLAARRNRASTSSKSTAGVRKFVSRVRNRGDTGAGVTLDNLALRYQRGADDSAGDSSDNDGSAGHHHTGSGASGSRVWTSSYRPPSGTPHTPVTRRRRHSSGTRGRNGTARTRSNSSGAADDRGVSLAAEVAASLSGPEASRQHVSPPPAPPTASASRGGDNGDGDGGPGAGPGAGGGAASGGNEAGARAEDVSLEPGGRVHDSPRSVQPPRPPVRSVNVQPAASTTSLRQDAAPRARRGPGRFFACFVCGSSSMPDNRPRSPPQ